MTESPKQIAIAEVDEATQIVTVKLPEGWSLIVSHTDINEETIKHGLNVVGISNRVVLVRTCSTQFSLKEFLDTIPDDHPELPNEPDPPPKRTG